MDCLKRFPFEKSLLKIKSACFSWVVGVALIQNLFHFSLLCFVSLFPLFSYFVSLLWIIVISNFSFGLIFFEKWIKWVLENKFKIAISKLKRLER
jgi:hypothetical protein